MNPAIWKKAISDAWCLLLASSIILALFSWLFVWLMSHFTVPKLQMLLTFVPQDFRGPIESMAGVPMEALITPLGRLSALYVHVVTMLICVGWALARGSDSISGEIGRGTMDLVLTLPVWRFTVMAVPAVVATIGAAVLVGSVWLGTATALARYPFDGSVRPGQFLPGAINLFSMVFCFTGITTLISSWNSDRWRTMAWSGGLFIVSLILELAGRMWEAGWWLNYLTFLSLFQPQKLILMPDAPGHAALTSDLTLLGIGLACYAAAAFVFWQRDIPAAR